MGVGAVSYFVFIWYAWCCMAIFYMAAGGGRKLKGRGQDYAGRRWVLVVEIHIYRSVGVRCAQRAFLWSRIFLFGAFWSSMSIFPHGGGIWVGAKNEGRRQILSRKRPILFVKSHIYRPSGIRSDPWAFLRSRILCLFGKFGVLCRFVTWRRAVGGGQK